jgi:hypothetical protein
MNETALPLHAAPAPRGFELRRVNPLDYSIGAALKGRTEVGLQASGTSNRAREDGEELRRARLGVINEHQRWGRGLAPFT